MNTIVEIAFRYDRGQIRPRKAIAQVKDALEYLTDSEEEISAHVRKRREKEGPKDNEALEVVGEKGERLPQGNAAAAVATPVDRPAEEERGLRLKLNSSLYHSCVSPSKTSPKQSWGTEA